MHNKRNRFDHADNARVFLISSQVANKTNCIEKWGRTKGHAYRRVRKWITQLKADQSHLKPSDLYQSDNILVPRAANIETPNYIDNCSNSFINYTASLLKEITFCATAMLTLCCYQNMCTELFILTIVYYI